MDLHGATDSGKQAILAYLQNSMVKLVKYNRRPTGPPRQKGFCSFTKSPAQIRT